MISGIQMFLAKSARHKGILMKETKVQGETNPRQKNNSLTSKPIQIPMGRPSQNLIKTHEETRSCRTKEANKRLATPFPR